MIVLMLLLQLCFEAIEILEHLEDISAINESIKIRIPESKGHNSPNSRSSSGDDLHYLFVFLIFQIIMHFSINLKEIRKKLSKLFKDMLTITEILKVKVFIKFLFCQKILRFIYCTYILELTI